MFKNQKSNKKEWYEKIKDPVRGFTELMDHEGEYKFDEDTKTIYMSQLFLAKASLTGTKEHAIFKKYMNENAGLIKAVLMKNNQ